MTTFHTFLFIFIHFIVTYAQISDKRLCADPTCSEPISLARTVIKFYSDDSRILSFPINKLVTIYSKAAGTRTDLWGAEIDGKRGYVPWNYVRETKILKTNLSHLVNTEVQQVGSNSATPTIPDGASPSEGLKEKGSKASGKIAPDPVSAVYEVIDGTTVYTGADPDVSTTPHIHEGATSENKLEETPPVSFKPGGAPTELGNKVEESVSEEENEEGIKLLHAKKTGLFDALSKYLFEDDEDMDVEDEDGEDEDGVEDEENEEGQQEHEVKETQNQSDSKPAQAAGNIQEDEKKSDKGGKMNVISPPKGTGKEHENMKAPESSVENQENVGNKRPGNLVDLVKRVQKASVEESKGEIPPTQVPETIPTSKTEKELPELPVEQRAPIVPTTEATLAEIPLPYDAYMEVAPTENPLVNTASAETSAQQNLLNSGEELPEKNKNEDSVVFPSSDDSALKDAYSMDQSINNFSLYSLPSDDSANATPNDSVVNEASLNNTSGYDASSGVPSAVNGSFSGSAINETNNSFENQATSGGPSPDDGSSDADSSEKLTSEDLLHRVPSLTSASLNVESPDSSRFSDPSSKEESSQAAHLEVSSSSSAIKDPSSSLASSEDPSKFSLGSSDTKPEISGGGGDSLQGTVVPSKDFPAEHIPSKEENGGKFGAELQSFSSDRKNVELTMSVDTNQENLSKNPLDISQENTLNAFSHKNHNENLENRAENVSGESTNELLQGTSDSQITEVQKDANVINNLENSLDGSNSNDANLKGDITVTNSEAPEGSISFNKEQPETPAPISKEKDSNLGQNDQTEDSKSEEESGFLSKVYTNIFGSLDENLSNEGSNLEVPTHQHINEVSSSEFSSTSTEDHSELKAGENFGSHEVSSDLTKNERGETVEKAYGSSYSPSEMLVDQQVVEDSAEERKDKGREVKGVYEALWNSHLREKPADKYLPPGVEPTETEYTEMQTCSSKENYADCVGQIPGGDVDASFSSAPSLSFEIPENAYNIFLYLTLTAVTVLLFSLGLYYLEKRRKDSTLIAVVNDLEQKLLVSTQESLLLQDQLSTVKEQLKSSETSSVDSDEQVTRLKQKIEEDRLHQLELEEQVVALEKELENATETGMELNRMIGEILSAQPGSECLMQNVERLQRQLNDQQVTINSMNASLGEKTTQNEFLESQLSISSEKVAELQSQLDKMVLNLLSAQEEKSKTEKELELQLQSIHQELESKLNQTNEELLRVKEDSQELQKAKEDLQTKLDLKNNEFTLLKEGMKEVQAVQSNVEAVKALLDVSKVKAEVQQLREEKRKLTVKLQQEGGEKQVLEKEVQVMIQEVKILKDKFEEAEREKVEAQTRLEVLSAYFKEKEAELQKEINENESKWMQKEGEATSTIERIRWIQEELQNYKLQNETLKKEILDQEVSLKSQISMLEKKSHDNWVLARQAERKLEESKQGASQLRNRLTIVEKNLSNSASLGVDDNTKLLNRIMSPLESNGELPVSPLHMGNVENPGSPPLLFPHRDHLTTSPPIPGLPPFMPPPPGVAFMPPHIPGVPPFMPPPPALFPGDHRPPPLGRMSSPPLHGRYSPDSRAYSPYDRDDSPPLSPSYPDSDYRRRSPPPPPAVHMPRNFSPYSGKGRSSHWERDDEHDFRGQQHRNKPRTHKGPGLSSGSGNSNESLDNSGRHSGRV